MHNYGHWKKTLALLVMSALSLGASSVDAMPEGGVIRSGAGAVSQNGKEMTIRQDSGRLAMDWTNFNVGKDETVRFQQPGKDALALNRVTGNQQSVIDGSLLSNGHVLLVNPNGVVIGKNASIDVGGLVASTAHVKDNFMKEFGNSTGTFTLGGVSDGKIINEGTINAEGGLVALHAAKVENSGTIKSNGGSVLMAVADTLTLTPDTDGKLNFTVDGKVAEASALNKGAITADGGTIVMTADSASDVMSTVVNNEGTLQARTLRKNEKGQILLEGNDKGQVEVSGTLDASGEGVGQDAGNIKVIGQKTIVHNGTNLLAKGDVNGGKIETSGDVLDLGDNLNIDAAGVNGKHGEWLLDPLEVLIQDEQPIQSSMDRTEKTVNGGSETQITYNDPPSATANADSTYASTSWIKTSLITDILKNGTDVTIQAASTSQAASITVNSAIKPKVEGDGEATLTLEAQRNVTINQEIAADKDGGKLNVKLNSDTDGDGVGAVIINADISTNGGTFTSGSGGNVQFDATQKDTKGNTIYETAANGKAKEDAFGNKIPKYLTAGYSSGGKYSGTANIQGHTVGTYFGYVTPAGKTVTEYSESRNITTNGGDINIYGEVAIGLNGGTLTLDTSKTGGNGGAVNITGIVNSGNSYEAYIYGTDKWNELVEKLVQEYLNHNSVPSYHFIGINYTYTKNADGTYSYSYTTKAKHFDQGDSHYAFHELKEGDVKGANWTYQDSEATLDTQHTRWYATTTAGDGYNSFIMEGTTPETSKMSIDDWLLYYRRTEPENYATRYAGGDSSKVVKYADIKADTDTTRMNNLKSDISALIAHNWFASKALANPSDKSGANHGDSYLATITTALENSLSTPNSQKTLWVGGRGSGVRNKTSDKKTNPYSQYPSDPSHQDGFYWVTGPEGLVTNENGTTGTKFWDTSSSDWSKGNYGSQVYGYTKWSSWSGGGQPDNSAPFLTVGYGNNNAWDDAAIDGGTTVGFVQETNLYNSSLNIKTAGGKVTLQGDIGKSVGLDTVNIDAGSGSVTTGNTNNTATKYNNGTIYADHGVYINGSNVTVGGEIHSGGTNVESTKMTDSAFSDYLDNVTIRSSNNLTVHGIEVNTSTDHSGNTTSRTDGERGKIKLISTGKDGVITLGDGVDYNGKNTNGGVLKAASTAQGAVVIDAQGSNGGFENKTSAEKAIVTGENGTWLIYSASPDKDIFGTNLDSKTDAEWTAKSKDNTNSSGKTMNDYDMTDSTPTIGKYIFQVQPVITVSGADTTKTYGVEWGTDELKKLISYSASYVNSDNTPIDVATGKDQAKNAFTNAFTELDYKNYISNADGTEVGEINISYSSKGAAGTADRVTGDKEDANHNKIPAKSDNQPAVYNLLVKKKSGTKGLHGYDVTTNDGSIEITKRQVTINQDGTITYGSNQGIAYEAPTSEEATDITGLTNEDTIGSVTMTASKEYQDSKGTRNTGDAGTYVLTTDGTNTHIVNNGKDVSVNYDISGSGTLTVEKATLTLDTGSTTKDYGDVAGVEDFLKDKKTNYTLDGFVNGDENDTDKQKTIRGQIIGVTNTSSALIDDNHTNIVLNGGNSGYPIDTVATPSDDLKNYNVAVKEGNTVTLKPVDINIYAEGNGSTLSDVTWTKIEKDKLVNGDSWDNFTFRVEPGDLISYADKTFGIKGYVNGQPISDGTQIGNYIYHPTGIVQLTFNPIVKPDVWAHSGGYRPRNKIETSLPVFRVEDAKVGQYGTYGVEHREGEDKLVLSATGMRLPEPDQVPDEERTFTTTLSTEEGSGTFKLEYNGVSLKVHPQDKKAEEVVRAGDKTKNVSLSEKALYVGYTEMGLDLIDLKGVYIYFN